MTTSKGLFLAALLVAGLATVPVSAGTNTEATGELAIDAGRLHAMLGKTELLLGLNEDETSPTTADTVHETDDPFVLLRDAVIRYDRDLSDACQQGAIAGTQCNQMLAPWWLASRTAPKGIDLRKLIDSTTPYVTALWKNVCRTRGPGPDPSLCEME